MQGVRRGSRRQVRLTASQRAARAQQVQLPDDWSLGLSPVRVKRSVYLFVRIHVYVTTGIVQVSA